MRGKKHSRLRFTIVPRLPTLNHAVNYQTINLTKFVILLSEPIDLWFLKSLIAVTLYITDINHMQPSQPFETLSRSDIYYYRYYITCRVSDL